MLLRESYCIQFLIASQSAIQTEILSMPLLFIRRLQTGKMCSEIFISQAETSPGTKAPHQNKNRNMCTSHTGNPIHTMEGPTVDHASLRVRGGPWGPRVRAPIKALWAGSRSLHPGKTAKFTDSAGRRVIHRTGPNWGWINKTPLQAHFASPKLHTSPYLWCWWPCLPLSGRPPGKPLQPIWWS